LTHEALRANQKKTGRTKALALLHKRRLLQNALQQRSVQLQNVQKLLLTVDSATTQQLVFNVLNNARTVLRTINAQSPSEDAIQDLFDELEHLKGEQERFESIVREHSENLTQSDWDDEELSKELEELITPLQPPPSHSAIGTISDDDEVDRLLDELEELSLDDIPPLPSTSISSSTPSHPPNSPSTAKLPHIPPTKTPSLKNTPSQVKQSTGAGESTNTPENIEQAVGHTSLAELNKVSVQTVHTPL